MDSPYLGSVLSGPAPSHPEWQLEVSDQYFEEIQIIKNTCQKKIFPRFLNPIDFYS